MARPLHVLVLLGMTFGCLTSTGRADVGGSKFIYGPYAAGGPRGGAGLSFVGAYAECGGMVACLGTGVRAGGHMGRYGSAYAEAGLGLLLLYFPFYLGAGPRWNEDERVTGQVSTGGGIGPFFLMFSSYREDESMHFEGSLGFYLLSEHWGRIWDRLFD